MEMTNRQYFCIKFDPTIVKVSLEWSDVLLHDATAPIGGALANVTYGQKSPLPVMMTKDGFIWIAMAGTRPDGLLERFTSGKVVISFSTKVNDFEDAGIKFSISADSRTVGNVENLRHDRITLTANGESVSILFSMSRPVVMLEKKHLENNTADSREDVLRNLRSDLRILEFYKSYDTDKSVATTLKTAISVIEAGQRADEEAIYASEEKLAQFISSNTDIVRRYKSRIG